MGSVSSGVQSRGWGLGPLKPENYAENLIECKSPYCSEKKKFSVATSEGDISSLSPLPYAPASHNMNVRDNKIIQIKGKNPISRF